MSATDLAIKIATTLDNTGLKKADKSVGVLSKSVKKLAKYLGPAVLGAAVVKFGKDSAKAFIEDQKQAAKLANVVKNLGLAFENPAIAGFIDKLTLASGVSDTQLRPAFQALLTTTGSVIESQKLLAQAIDISAGSGVELGTVAQDLANAYVGNTKGLKKYNLGLTQAELKSAKFVDIQKKLNALYKGSNAAYLETYAGKMEVLTNAVGEAQEIIGGALIQSLMDFTGAIDAADLATKIISWSTALSDFIDDFTWTMKKASFLTSDKALLSGINPFSNYVSKGLAKIDAERAAAEFKRAMAGATSYDPANNSVTGYKKDEAAKAKAAKDAAKRAADLAKATAKNTAELKKQSTLKKSGSVFDMEQIQRIAALKGNLSEEDRLRVQAQLALLNDNDVLAKKLTDQILDAQDKSGQLKAYFYSIGDTKIANPFAFLDTWVTNFQAKLNSLKLPDLSVNLPNIMAGNGGNGATPYGGYNGSGGVGADGGSFYLGGEKITIPSSNATSIPLGGSSGTGNTFNTITVNGSILTDQMLTDLIQNGLQGASLSGSPSQIGRIQGMFG